MDGPLPPPTADAKRKVDESAKEDIDGNDDTDSPVGKDELLTITCFNELVVSSIVMLRRSYMDVLQELCQGGHPACIHKRKHMEILLWKVP
jgi:hypothetical protein